MTLENELVLLSNVGLSGIILYLLRLNIKLQARILYLESEIKDLKREVEYLRRYRDKY
jgi:hypothetical protein